MKLRKILSMVLVVTLLMLTVGQTEAHAAFLWGAGGLFTSGEITAAGVFCYWGALLGLAAYAAYVAYQANNAPQIPPGCVFKPDGSVDCSKMPWVS